jgi:hypothetical protein
MVSFEKKKCNNFKIYAKYKDADKNMYLMNDEL